jgi:hypothetical protein
MEQTSATDITAEGLTGFFLSALSHYMPNIMLFMHGGTVIQSIDDKASAVWHVLSAIIATVTLADIGYKKYKAWKGNKPPKK